MSQAPATPPLTWLYVPADRPDRVEKALASRAHGVIVDLEDGVAPGSKAKARASLSGLLDRQRGKPVHVRVNSPRSELGAADLEAIGALAGVTGIRIPKVEGVDDVRLALELLPASHGRIHCLIESAVGVEKAYEIAVSSEAIAGISLGEADLRAETGAVESGLDWPRSRIVNAAVAAGLPRPAQSVYPHVRDLEGLARSCVRGRELGHLGRAAIHPDQLEIIEQAYLPTTAEAALATETLARFAQAGAGAIALAGGEFVDAAIVRSASQVVALAGRFGTRPPP